VLDLRQGTRLVAGVGQGLLDRRRKGAHHSGGAYCA